MPNAADFIVSLTAAAASSASSPILSGDIDVVFDLNFFIQDAADGLCSRVFMLQTVYLKCQNVTVSWCLLWCNHHSLSFLVAVPLCSSIDLVASNALNFYIYTK